MPKPAIELNEREFALARVELLEAWKRLEVSKERFIAAVAGDSDLPAWCEGKRDARAARAAAISAFADFFYVGKQSAKSVHRLVGLIGVSRETIRRAVSLNQEKRAFAQCMKRLQHCVWIDDRQERHPLVRNAFQQIKIARLNTIQVTRQVVIVEPGLLRISWCISRKPRIKQVMREEVIQYIRQKPERVVRFGQALRELERLAPQTLLARYRPGDKLAIANATYLNQWGNTKNRQYTSGMPLLIELAPGEILPSCHAPERTPAKRQSRPSNIESTDFVTQLKLRRYRLEPKVRRPVVRDSQRLSRLFRGP